MLRGLLGGYARGRRQTSAATLYLDFLDGLNDSRITYSGGANGTRVNSAGLIVAATTPRYDYNPVTLAARGLLVEEARTNLMLRSQEMATAPWFNSGLTSIANNTNEVLAPDGLNTATKVVATGVASALGQTATLTATAYAGSIYLRCATGTMAMDLLVYLNGAPFTVIGTTSIVVTTTWQRFSVVTSAATAVAYNLQLNSIAAGTLYAWGAQLEAGAFPTSYIPTTTAAVTRTADSAVMTGADFLIWYNQSEGTFVVSGDLAFPANGANQFLAYASDNSYNNLVAVNDGNTGFGAIVTAAGGVFDGAAGVSNAFTANTPFKIAAAYAANSLAVCVDAQTVATDGAATIPTVLTRLAIGSDHLGANHIGSGHIATIQYFPRRSANTQLQAMTA